MTVKSVSRWTVTFIACLFSLQVMASTAKLVNLLVDQAGLTELLARKGIRGDVALDVKKFVDLSLRSLNNRNASPSPNQLKAIINNLQVGEEDAVLYKSHLKKVLDTPAGDLSKKDVADAINGLIYLANRHGRRGAFVLACANCTSASLAEHGLKFTLEVPSSAEAKNVLTKILPRQAKKLRTYISTNMNALGMGDFSKVGAETVSGAEERALGLFVALGAHGSKAQRDLVQTILKAGDGQLFNDAVPHRLWKIMANDLSDTQVKNLDAILKESLEVSQKEGIALDEAFYKTLRARAQKDGIPAGKVDNMQKKNCFFRK